MAGLADIIRNGVAIIDSITTTLQANVQHAAWVAQDGQGDEWFGQRVNGVFIRGRDPLSPGIAVERLALVEYQQKIRNIDGRLIVTYAHVMFLRPFEAVSALDAPERSALPVDPRDVIILPNGKTGPIIDSTGFMDSDTGQPYFYEVWLGTLTERSV